MSQSRLQMRFLLSTFKILRMEKLESLPSVSRLSPGVLRVLGQNPGNFTLQGTNTYIIGTQNPYTLIDVGEGREEYSTVLEDVLRNTLTSQNPQQALISDIVFSHWHHDHVGGLPSVISLLRKLWREANPSLEFPGPRLHKFPLPTSFDPKYSPHKLPGILESLPPGSFTKAADGNPLHELRDAQVLQLSDLSIHVLHTPGHTPDSISLYLPSDKALYTADTVLGQGTAIFDDLSVYINSLKKMLSFPHEFSTLYPAHGPVVSNGQETIETYIKHRLERENQILEVVRSTPPVPEEGASDTPYWTTWSIVAKIYAAYPEAVWMGAARGVDLHLQKLEKDGAVRRSGGEGVQTRWVAVL